MNRTSVLTAAAGLAVIAGSAPALRAQTGGGGPNTGPYHLVDKIEDAWVNRNPVPIRPMVFMPDGSLWAVNPYLSQVVKIINLADPEPDVVQTFRTLPGPVAIARHQLAPENGGNEQLLVVCQHVNAVAVHDATSGNLVNVIPVRARPADVLVDQLNHRAWVSCAAADVVLEIDLSTMVQTTYVINSKSPSFLSMYDGEVLVAPRISGNGSLVDRKPVTLDNEETLVENEHAGPLGIRDTLDVLVAAPPAPGQPDNGLPDQDLFWLDHATGTAKPIAKSTGTLLFGHAVQPGTNTLWQLNLEANNKNPKRQTEPSIQGEAVSNRLTKIDLPALVPGAAPSFVFTPDPNPDNLPSGAIISLDDAEFALGIQLPDDPAELASAVGTPYSLAFDSDGKCYVAGLLTDNVIVLNGDGTRTGGVLFLPQGTMPRQVLLSQDGEFLAVWGSGDDMDADCKAYINQVGAVDFSDVSLGSDPTPDGIRKGRKVFFDASHSKHNNASCSSCHDEGKTDMLAWNLSNIHLQDSENPLDDDGLDNKGPMVTQTLTGISTALPFHWRGEQQRGLLDFNAAFEDLLGGTELATTPLPGEPLSEFHQFQAFVLSLTEDANQFQNPKRILDDSILPPGITAASAVAGQEKFSQTDEDPPNAFNQCRSCHSLPTGTNNEVVDNRFSGERLTKRLWLDVASFQGLQFKGMQPNVNVTLLSGQEDPEDPTGQLQQVEVYPLLGTGLSHAGVVTDLRPFMLTMLGDETQAVRDNVTSFMFQFDTGAAPATHAFKFMNSSNANATVLALNLYLLKQASTAVRNCDVAVVGRLGSGGVPVGPFRGWAYNRSNQTFRDEVGGSQTLTYLKNQAIAGGWFAFVGMPVGTARKFAIDFDGDELLNGLEPPGGMFDVDTDNDLYWDGVENKAGSDPNDITDVPHVPESPPDTTAPVLTPSTPAFQWFTEKVARLTFETDEPLTTARLELTPGSGSAIVVIESTPKMQHNLLVTSMNASVTYDVLLTVTDLAQPSGGNSRIVSNIPDLTAASRHSNPININSLVVEGLEWGEDPAVDVGTGDWTFKAVGVVNQRMTIPPVPAAVVMVVARVLINGRPATSDRFEDGPLDFDERFDTFVIREPLTSSFDPSVTPLSGPFLVGRVPGTGPFAGELRTNSSGNFDIQFTLNGLNVGDTVTLSIEAAGPSFGMFDLDGDLIEETPFMGGRTPGSNFWADNTTPIPEYVPSFWSFPDTADADNLDTPLVNENGRKLEFEVPQP